MIKAVLLDMDGLLVDTEPLGINVAVKICKQLGINLTSTERKSFIGVTDQKFYEKLFHKRNLKYNVRKILEEHFALYEELLRTNLTPFVGAKSLLIELKFQGHKLGLVSGSTSIQIDIVLNQLGLKKCFDVIVSSNDTVHSKPHPQGYSLAAKELGVVAEECLVLEDATTGVIAAKKAGMKVIGVINKGGQDLSLADCVAQDLIQVMLIVNKHSEYFNISSYL